MKNKAPRKSKTRPAGSGESKAAPVATNGGGDSRKPGQLPPLTVRTDAAGIDIGSREIAVAVPPDSDSKPVRRFATFTADLHAVADWLRQCGVRTVAMESTSVYWVPLMQILEDRGFEVFLVNAHHIKNVSGRPTDVGDCQWIQQLHSVGLLRASFRPAQQVCAVRSRVRERRTLTELASQCVEHMQKALDQMNLHLHHVISDLTGQTGLRILDAILDGERDSGQLAKLRDRRIRASADQVRKALEGDYRPEHLAMLRRSLERYRFLLRQIAECDTEIEAGMEQLTGPPAGEAAPIPAAVKKLKAGPGSTAEQAEKQRQTYCRLYGVDLTRIDGIGLGAIEVLATEVGPDFTRFRSAAAFTSWAGVAPRQEISGGKLLRTATPKNKSRVAYALRMAAQSLLFSKSPLGDQFRRLRTRRGMPKAVTAFARRLGCLIYLLVTRRTEFDRAMVEQQQKRYEEAKQNRLRREAEKRGFRLVPMNADEATATA